MFSYILSPLHLFDTDNDAAGRPDGQPDDRRGTSTMSVPHRSRGPGKLMTTALAAVIAVAGCGTGTGHSQASGTGPTGTGSTHEQQGRNATAPGASASAGADGSQDVRFTVG